MSNRRRMPKLTYANVVATLALFIALGGGAYAAKKIGSKGIKRDAVRAKHIKKNAVRSKEIKKNAVKSKDIKNSQVKSKDIKAGGVSGSDIRDGAVGEDHLAALEAYRVIGATGQPEFSDGNEEDCLWGNLTGTVDFSPAAFRRDAYGVVRLTGVITQKSGTGGDATCDTGAGDEATEDTTAFILPEGYRPPELVIYSHGGNSMVINGTTPQPNGPGGGTIPAGAVLGALVSTPALLLDGVTFTTAESSAGLTGAPAPLSGGPSPSEITPLLGG